MIKWVKDMIYQKKKLAILFCRFYQELIIFINSTLCICNFFFNIEYTIYKRDLKPENILYSNKNQDNILKIIDFGIAKIIKPNNRIISPTSEVICCKITFLSLIC